MKKIFIVEDEAIVALELKDQLRALGYEVCGHAARGESALQQIPEARPDLVLMDINLGKGISGLEVAERLRALIDVPVIFLTAYSDAKLTERVGRSMSFAYIVKPFEPLVLRANIELALGRRDAMVAARPPPPDTEHVGQRAQGSRSLREDLLRTVIGGAPLVIFALDREGRFTLSEGKALSLIGLTPGQVVGMSAFDLYAGVPGLDEYLRRALAGETVHYRSCVGPTWFDATYTPTLDPEGKVAGVVGVAFDITDQVRAEEALRLTRDQLDATLQALPDLLFEVDEDGRILGFHATRVELLAAPPEHFLGKTLHEVLPADVADAGLDTIRVAARDGYALGRPYRLELPDGERWFEASVARRATLAGEGARFVLLARDITDRVCAEQSLASSEQLFRTLAQVSPVGIYRIMGGRCTYVNDRLCEIMGLTAEAATTGGWWSRVHPDDLARAREDWERAARETKPFSSEYRCVRPDGSVVWVLSEARVDAGRRGEGKDYVGTLTDVTEGKRAEEALRASQARLNEAQRIAQLGSWELDLRTSALTWSDEIFRIFEIDPAEFGASYEAFLNAVHPDDRGAVDEAYTRSVATREPYEITHRLRMADGRIKHVQERCETFCAPDGTPIRSAGTVQEITRQRQAELQLQLTREQLEATLQAIPDLLFEMDQSGRYLAVHAQRAQQLAAPPEQLLGRNVREVLSPGGAEVVLDALHEAAAAGVSFGHAFRLDLPDGEHWFELSIARKAAPRGHDHTFIVLSRDITERKRTEDALKLSLSQKSLLLREVHHRVKNNLQVISSLLHLQRDSTKDPSARALLDESRARVKAIAAVHELLTQSDDLSRIDFAVYLKSVTRGLIAAHAHPEAPVRLSVDAAEALLDIQVAVPCGLIVNELLTNVLKYAFPDERSGELRVGFGRNAAGRWVLSVADDGIGLPETVDPHAAETLGLRLVHTLATQIDAVMRVERGPGTRFEFTFAG